MPSNDAQKWSWNSLLDVLGIQNMQRVLHRALNSFLMACVLQANGPTSLIQHTSYVPLPTPPPFSLRSDLAPCPFSHFMLPSSRPGGMCGAIKHCWNAK